MRKYYQLFLVLCLFLVISKSGTSQNNRGQKSDFPGNGKYNSSLLGKYAFVLDPGMDMKEIQTLIDTLYNMQHERKSEFSTNRYALLFKPGTYQLNIKMGYYMHALGLGKSPDDVVINGDLISKGLFNNGNVTCNFWRSVENLTMVPTGDSTMIWGVSQAAPMRRVHVKGSIQLHDHGWASGGFLADSKIDGTVYSGPQQQWFSRNDDLGAWKGGSWNMMFVGVHGAPAEKWPANPYTVITETPEIREKPYLFLDNGDYSVAVPKLKKNSSGVSWMNQPEDVDVLKLSSFYLVTPTDQSASINAALKAGKNLLFTPGIYPINESLKITRPGTVVMGIGMATLVSANGNSIIEISDVDRVTMCGLLFDAGKLNADKLLQVGEPNSHKNHAKQPSYLFDLFFRVGGPAEGSASSCFVINSNNVRVDHTWIWRADHGNGVGWDKNKSANGLIVNGDHVTIYGLFNEHFQEYQTIWNGEHGRLYFYQSELPYDPPTVDSWKHGGTGGYASYKVSDKVKSHEAIGLGIYCVFYQAPVIVDNTIETPQKLEKNIHHKIIFWLNGNKESKILNVINGKGDGVNITRRKTVME
ncbi:MAG: coagulation factor 5/8 type domain-containing protein [Prolixibacteraceae bacterium]